MQESMRLFPVVGSGTTRRNLEKDMWLGGGKLFVPKGVLLWVPMHAVQNVSANWDEPDKFQPERWSQVSRVVDHVHHGAAMLYWNAMA